jgi:hypothetical protein
MARRGISREITDNVMTSPGQKVREVGDLICYQSLIGFSGKSYLVRILVNEKKDPMMIVTVYRTSKIEKYWGKL